MKGISRRVVVVDAPDPRLFEQAIFIVRNDALREEGISQERLIHEACRLAKGCAGADRSGWRGWRLPPWSYAALGGGAIGLLWLLVSIF